MTPRDAVRLVDVAKRAGVTVSGDSYSVLLDQHFIVEAQLDHLTEGGPVICETLRGHLVIRDSTGPPRKE